ncbi:putative Receptor protein kinase [Melia azedarach]|uniref:Receptor protein kinase n=1 Tax=Melia azedarach TaxID=155640 RepID=A0ACC1X5A3_MELAZ|nr:putative Receptor protein kinase [Melia azedarach]
MSSLWRRNRQEKKDNTIFLKNGAVLLEKLISCCEGKRNPIRSFSLEELKIATNNFDEYQVSIDRGYELYKGSLQNRPVSILYWCRYEHYDDWKEDSCYNNIIFPIQISHKNVLKLIGCCLDTKLPTLVFESSENGALADRIHGRDGHHFEPLLLVHRFKIAMEIANAVAYLHIGFRRPIVFKDIKPSNILFDEENVAKLFDFSLSESIPEGETHVKNDQLVGTFGFLAPEYLTTSRCNEKCDVFSFGMLLLDLLTGKTITSPVQIGQHDGCHLMEYVKKHAENDTLYEIIDPIIVQESSYYEKKEQVLSFLLLICECASQSPEERPTMMSVAKRLRQLYLSVA